MVSHFYRPSQPQNDSHRDTFLILSNIFLKGMKSMNFGSKLVKNMLNINSYN